MPPRLPNLRLAALIAALAASRPAVFAAEPPHSWIDPDTGHRVIRMTEEPNSVSFYFNDNAYTPDGKEMVYTTRHGISVLNLATLASRPVVQGRCRAIVVGHVTPTVYYLRPTDDRQYSTLWCTNVDTGATREIAKLPRRASIATINADETLAAGTYIEGDAQAPGAYGGALGPPPSAQSGNHIQPPNKGSMMAARLAAKLPMTLFTLDLRTGHIAVLLQHSTDWINHMQFSPTVPDLLLYCHEGIWQHVDRIWTIRTDGSGNQLVHKRIMEMEIAGHEWWDANGITVRYQLQFPRDEPYGAMLASYDVDSGQRVWLHLEPGANSIHCNSSPDGKLFCGDGTPGFPWIALFRPVYVKDDDTLGQNLIKGGYLVTEKLVNLAKHQYHLEPNPSFTPDEKWVVFASNMFGPTYVFEVEVAKAR